MHTINNYAHILNCNNAETNFSRLYFVVCGELVEKIENAEFAEE
jgi:hypothetical protein